MTSSVRRVLCALLLEALPGAAFALGAGSAPAIPAEGRRPESAVPFEIVRTVALARAAATWPSLAAGPVIPYQDIDGSTIAYMFHYRVDGLPFPADCERTTREAREDVARFRDEGGAPPTGKYRYAHVLVSARYDRFPILSWGEGLSEFYSTAEQARDAAAAEMGLAEPKLTRIYSVWPESWYEFEGNGRAIVVHSHLMSQREPAPGFTARMQARAAANRQQLAQQLAQQGRTTEQYLAALRNKSEQQWRQADKPPGRDGQVFVGGYNQAPFYDWSYGCTPTSSAMIFGWLDRAQNFSRFVRWYFQRWDPIERDADYNVPNCQRDLAWAMGTDSLGNGATQWDNIQPGIEGVARSNNYSITDANYDDHNGDNDYCWGNAVDAINVGQALLMSYDRQDGHPHTVAVFGYDDAAQDYYVHTTWAPPGEWWSYSNGGNQYYTRLDVFQPQLPAEGPYILLLDPCGDMRYDSTGHGEIWHVWERQAVMWYASNEDSVWVDFSTNGGLTWIFAGKSTSSYLSVNVVPWMADDNARYRVTLFCHGIGYPAYLAGADGSHGNFRIVNEAPPAPTIITPPNNEVFNGIHPVEATLIVHRISYADSYRFYMRNDSVGIWQSGWIADTFYRPQVVWPIGSTGYWWAQAKNPTGIGPQTINATYRVGPGYTYPKHKPYGKKKAVKHGGAVAHRRRRRSMGLEQPDDYLYLLNGNNTLDFLRYSTWYDSWTPACSLPAGPRNKRVKVGATLIADEDFAYAFKGGGTSEFYRYDLAADAWTALASPTFFKGLRGGFAALADIDSLTYIYAGSGSSSYEYSRYNIQTGAWETPTPPTLPIIKAKIGSSFTTDAGGHLYLLLGGYGENLFYSLNLNNPAEGWVQRASLPLVAQTRKKKVKEGGCIEYFQGKIYAVKGGKTREFWCYDPSLNSWTYVCEVGDGSPVPPTKGISCGRSLTANDFGIYILFGNNTDDFYFFSGNMETPAAPPNQQTASVSPLTPLALKISPNPVRNRATISYSLPLPGRVSLKLYDVTGKLVSTLAYGNRPAGPYSIGLSAVGGKLSAGLYLLRLDTQTRTSTAKLIIE